MTWLMVPTVLVASLLGSLHCAAMCGAFACFASDRGGQTDLRLQSPYQGGRLMAYLILGAVAGAMGFAVNSIGWRAGLAGTASLGMGLLLIVWGGGRLLALWRHTSTLASRPPAWWHQMAGGWLQRLRDASPPHRALATGLLTGLLPCGWLWVFVIVASGTGHIATGMLTMAIFWLGSVPALVGVVVGARHLGAKWHHRLPLLSSTLILLLGLMSVAGHLGWIPTPAPLHDLLPGTHHMTGVPHG